jgi:4-hydroxybenzoate polyprenyltransferase
MKIQGTERGMQGRIGSKSMMESVSRGLMGLGALPPTEKRSKLHVLEGALEITRPFLLVMGAPAVGIGAFLAPDPLPSPIYLVAGAFAVMLGVAGIHVFNDWVDRVRDREVWPWRPIPAGRFPARWAPVYAAALLGAALAGTWALFGLPAFLVLLLAEALGVSYCLMLRDRVGYLSLPPIIGLFPLGGWAAVSPDTLFSDPMPWLLFAMVTTWQAGHIMVYSPAHPGKELHAGEGPNAEKELHAGEGPNAEKELHAGEGPNAEKGSLAGEGPNAEKGSLAGEGPNAEKGSGDRVLCEKKALFFYPTPRQASILGLVFNVLTLAESLILLVVAGLGVFYWVTALPAGALAVGTAFWLLLNPGEKRRSEFAFNAASIYLALLCGGAVLDLLFRIHLHRMLAWGARSLGTLLAALEGRAMLVEKTVYALGLIGTLAVTAFLITGLLAGIAKGSAKTKSEIEKRA